MCAILFNLNILDFQVLIKSTRAPEILKKHLDLENNNDKERTLFLAFYSEHESVDDS